MLLGPLRTFSSSGPFSPSSLQHYSLSCSNFEVLVTDWGLPFVGKLDSTLGNASSHADRRDLPPSSRDRRLSNRRRLDSLAQQRHLLQGASRALHLTLPLRGALRGARGRTRLHRLGGGECLRDGRARREAGAGLWLGLYQNETGLGPAKGWGRCVAGDAPSFTNWHEGQPDDYHGYQQDCAWVDAGSGQWRALACDGGVRFDPLPWRIAELSCLCAHGNASAAFADDRKALEATSGYNQRLLTRRTAISFSIAAALAVLPTLLLLGRMGWRRLRRGANAAPRLGCRAAQRRPRAAASTTGAASDYRPGRGLASGSRLLSRGRKREPQAPRQGNAARGASVGRWAAAARQLCHVAGGVGAMRDRSDTFVYSDVTGQSIAAAVGDRTTGGCWWPHWAAASSRLALFPTDARAIRVVCATLPVVGIGIAALNTVSALAGNRPAAVAFPIAAAELSVAAAALVPTAALLRRSRHAAPPRPAAAVEGKPPLLPG